MQQFAAIDDRKHGLPDPGALWVKARLLQTQAAMDRASRPITRVQIAAYVIVAAGWAALVTWKWSDLQRWLLGFTPTQMVQSMSHGSLSVTFLLTVVVLATMTVMLGLHTILAED
jgi:uncharacterized membrane protein